MADLSPGEKLKKANDELHAAFDEVLMDEYHDVETKARAASVMSHIFEELKTVHDILEAE